MAETGPASRLTATDVGVTADTVKVGVLLFDIGGVGMLGLGVPGADADSQQRYWQAFIDDVNESGGILGRMIVPVYERFEPTRPDDVFRACIALTEDAKVFLVFGTSGFGGDAALCVTEQHGTLLLSVIGEPEEYYQRGKGLLVTIAMSGDRMGRTMVTRAHEEGFLEGTTIGIVMDERPPSRVPTKRSVLPQLERLGYKAEHVTSLSGDSSTAQSQIPVEISQMRAKGVNLVLFTANAVYSNIWFNEAEAQRFRPLYIASDLNTTSNDFAVQSAPSTLRAIAYTVGRLGEARAGQPEQPEIADCGRRYQHQTGQRIERSDSGFAYGVMYVQCAQVSTFVRIASAAGAELKRSSFVGAAPRLAPFAVAGHGGTITFANKSHGANFVRRLVFNGGCRCWNIASDFAPAPP